MYDQSLKASLLPAELIIKNFVHGEECSNYEMYLIELINQCSFFLEKSKGNRYAAPKSEANGEYDCNSETYKFDFKLIASKTELQARSIFSLRVSVMADGATITSEPKCKGKMMATCIHVALRHSTYEQLLQIRKDAPKKQGINNDILEFLTTIETKKNLLLYFPYYFSFSSQHDFDDGASQIIEAINTDFQSAWRYRNEQGNSLDTFFCFLYDKHMVFCQLARDGLHRVGAVKLVESKTFYRLNDLIFPKGVDVN